MALGEKLFEETGTTTNFKITKVHPIEGITMEISFTSEIKGIGKFPSGKNMGSGTATQYPHGVVDAVYQGAFMIIIDKQQYASKILSQTITRTTSTRQ